ncbi:MAG TPA: hypothetical protein VN783_02020 [Thermoanaerobaculia bacterium]|nr:hypothetical protein [Thermoanaerobaculia bacterium]
MDRLEPKPNGSLEDLERHSLAIYVGTVEEIRPGFWSGIPYSLLAVKVTEVFRSSASIASDFVYVPVPTANFSLGGRRYCTDGTRGYRPKLGDRALLFLYDPALDTAKSLVFPRFGETVFESAPGRLVFDPGLKKQDDWMAAATFDDVLRFLRSTSTHTGQ